MTRPTYQARARVARDELERLLADHAEAQRIGDSVRASYARHVTTQGAQRVLAASEAESRAWRAVKAQQARLRSLEQAARIERTVFAGQWNPRKQGRATA